MNDSFLIPDDAGRSVSHGGAELVVSSGANQGYAVSVHDELWIGRDPASGMQLFDEAVSLRHCRIHRRGGIYYLEDNRSRNGTLLNGTPIQSHLLYHRDRILCGTTALQFLCPSCPNPRKTTVMAVPVSNSPAVERFESPMDVELIERALLRETRRTDGIDSVAQSLIAGYSVIQTLAQPGNWEEMFQRLLEELPRLVPHEIAVICRHNPRTHRIFPVVHRRPPVTGAPPRIAIDEELISRSCTERRCIAQRREDGRWTLIAPMSGPDAVQGLLYLETSSLPDPETALALLAGVCRQAGMVLRHADLLNALRQKTMQLQEASHKLERERSILGSLLSSLREGIVLVSPDGRVLLANSRGERCLETLCRRDEQGSLLEVGGFPWPTLAARCTAEQTPAPRELISEAGGKRFEFRMIHVPLAQDGAALETRPPSAAQALVFHDVTDLRQQEDAIRRMQKLEAVGTLAGGIAHEFNNILASIGTEAASALEFGEWDYARDSLQNILEALKTATGLTRDLLNFAKPQDLQREPVDLAELLGRALQFIRQDLRNRRIEVVTSLDPVPRARVDARQIQQVLINLLTNARDAMPDGGTITLTLRSSGEWTEIRVTDTGQGIRPEHVDRIFDPFFTTKGPYGKSKIPGTGLGLSVALGIVRQHGGKIEVRSEFGRGTEVTILLPPAGA